MKPEWTIDYLKENNILFVKTSAPLKWEQIKQLSEKAYSISRDKGSRGVLIDYRGMDIQLSVLEIDKIPDMVKKMGAGPEDKVAVLYNASSPKIGLLNFLQNALYLKAIRMKIFPEPEKAIAWLSYDDSSPKKPTS